MTQQTLIGDVVAAITRVDDLVQQTNAARAVRDRAVVAALDDGIRPSVLRRATGLSTSMIRFIRDQARRSTLS